MNPKLSLILATALAFVLLASLGWWQYGRAQSLRSERDQARQETLTAQAQNHALQQSFNAYVTNTEQIAVEVRAALAQQASTTAQLQKVYQDDDQAKDWADQPVPAGISRLFQPPPANH